MSWWWISLEYQIVIVLGPRSIDEKEEENEKDHLQVGDEWALREVTPFRGFIESDGKKEVIRLVMAEHHNFFISYFVLYVELILRNFKMAGTV